MSGLHKNYKTDPIKDAEGVEVPFPECENDDGSIPTFIIAQMGSSNKAYSKALDVAIKPYRRQMQLGVMKNEVADNVIRGVFCETVLKGWKNIQDENGKSIPFSKENAIALLTELPLVYERLQEEAKQITNFRVAAQEEEAKN